ncbi:MAG: hypothetical protein NXI16_01365 [Alphaproteobacteria bacterium]|nr:hypothetical protein [Alphaproteobacteria bacterium]
MSKRAYMEGMIDVGSRIAKSERAALRKAIRRGDDVSAAECKAAAEHFEAVVARYKRDLPNHPPKLPKAHGGTGWSI